jgi:tRNA (guanine-N7-)-methyltransferase
LPVIRVRQHVNPLSHKYQTSVEPVDWESVFRHPQQPLHLDIGCGKGLFAQEMALTCPDWNFLGLEIRQPLVAQALQRRDQLGLKNLHFIFCNANHALKSLLVQLPDDRMLQRVSIQFPDPWFKKRHQKRRVVQPQLVQDLAQFMPAGGWVWLQSDVESVALDMVERFAQCPDFQRQGETWLSETLMPVRTDRERVTLAQGKPIYRALFTRTDHA